MQHLEKEILSDEDYTYQESMECYKNLDAPSHLAISQSLLSSLPIH